VIEIFASITYAPGACFIFIFISPNRGSEENTHTQAHTYTLTHKNIQIYTTIYWFL